MARELGWSPAEQHSMIDAFNAAMHAQIAAEDTVPVCDLSERKVRGLDS
jgi:hypothetical protein